MAFENPATKALVRRIEDELLLAEVIVRRSGRGFDLRHAADRDAADRTLRVIGGTELGGLAQFAGNGAFRPLKSAPNLRRGWLFRAASEEQLELALDQLYPGAIADLYAVESGAPPITNFREFTDRQTGMYRITAMLGDAPAARVIRACCDAHVCLKRRLWSVDGLPPDGAEAKSVIPCLEPCPLLLEFARKATRIEQAGKEDWSLSADDAASLMAGLEIALRNPAPEIREADFDAPENPRRLRFALEKLRAMVKQQRTTKP